MAGPAPASEVLLVEDLGRQMLPARRMAAALRQAGFGARLVHFGAEVDPGSLVALARAECPRLIVLSILFANRVEEQLALVRALRTAGMAAHVSLAGPLPALAATELLAACPALDSVLCGEAGAAVSLAAALRDGSDWRALPGVWPDCGGILHPDTLPPPAWDDIPLTVGGLGYATVEGSRGCYHACTFCLPCAHYRAVPGPAYRLRSVSHLVDEMEALYRRGVRLFLFDDEQFLPPGRSRFARVQALGDAWARRGLTIAFTLKCRADDVDEGLFRHLQALGLLRVYLGIESGCQASLDLFGKGVTVERNVEALALLDALGVVVDFRCLLFHPWSTLETVRTEIDFLARILPHVPTPFAFREVECYAGTPLAARLQREGRADGRPWMSAYTLLDPAAELLRRLARLVFGARDAPEGLHERIVRAWYDLLLERRFRLGEGLLADPTEAERVLRKSVTYLNRVSLAVWWEMLEWAGSADPYDAAEVNARAAGWAGRVRALDATAGSAG